jgi:hypothetical protein
MFLRNFVNNLQDTRHLSPEDCNVQPLPLNEPAAIELLKTLVMAVKHW